jgi:hypothetical protein
VGEASAFAIRCARAASTLVVSTNGEHIS